MKKLFSVFGFVLVFGVSVSWAGSGKAIIPSFDSYSSTKDKSVYYISNTTGNNVEVTVTFYKEDGTVVTPSGNVTYVNFYNSDTEIQAGKTGIVTIYPSTQMYGYAVIEWVNTGSGDDTYALVAQGFIEVRDGSNNVTDRYSVPVNCGRIF